MTGLLPHQRRLRDQMIAAVRVHRAGGKPRPPEAGRLLWTIFAELGVSRSYRPDGRARPISHSELDAFTRLHRWPLSGPAIEIIRAMDRALVEVREATHPILTAAAFDAVFG